MFKYNTQSRRCPVDNELASKFFDAASHGADTAQGYAPFRKFLNSAQCGRFALILWRLVKGSFFCFFLGQIVTWQYNPNLLD